MKRILHKMLNVSTVCCGLLFAISAYSQNGQQRVIQETNSLTDFEATPFYIKVKAAFTSLALNSDVSMLSDEDLEIVSEAISTNYPMNETFKIFINTCSWFEENISAGNQIDVAYIARQQQLAEISEQSSVSNHFLQAYNELSSRAKSIVNTYIEQIRGTNAISIMATDFEALAESNPQRTVTSYAKFCANLDNFIAQHNNSSQREVLQFIVSESEEK